MRTYDQLKTEIAEAIAQHDVERVRDLAAEADGLGQPLCDAVSAYARAFLERWAGDLRQAVSLYQTSATAYRQLGDGAGEAEASVHVGNLYAMTGQFEAALEQYHSVNALYETIGDSAGIARITGNMGNVFFALGEYPKALEQYQRALLLHEQNNDQLGIARTTSNKGNVYFATGDYPQALECYRSAEVLLSQLHDRAGVATIVGNLGNVYAHISDQEQALEHYQRALLLHQEIGDHDGIATVTGNIANVLAARGEHEQALEHLERALSIHQDLGDRVGAARVDGNIVGVLISMGRYVDAQARLTDQEHDAIEDPVVHSGHHVHRARLAQERGDLDEANAQLLHALEVAATSGARAQEADVHSQLRTLAQARVDLPSYIQHNEHYLRITEEIRGKETTQKLAMMEAERRLDGERREHEKHRAILHSTLPKHVADRMVRGEQIHDLFDHAAVLFADIVGFTSHTAEMDPKDVIDLLANIFSSFDNICEHNGVTKVKTIGDSYMCFKGDASAEENAGAVANVALAIQDTRHSWPGSHHEGVPVGQGVGVPVGSPESSPEGSRVAFRIGMHLGPVTAGVIGTERLQYDIWGDTVNMASRLEGSGEAGKIQVSEAVAALLNNSATPGTWHVARRGAVELKGKGTVTTYWLS